MIATEVNDEKEIRLLKKNNKTYPSGDNCTQGETKKRSKKSRGSEVSL